MLKKAKQLFQSLKPINWTPKLEKKLLKLYGKYDGNLTFENYREHTKTIQNEIRENMMNSKEDNAAIRDLRETLEDRYLMLDKVLQRQPNLAKSSDLEKLQSSLRKLNYNYKETKKIMEAFGVEKGLFKFNKWYKTQPNPAFKTFSKLQETYALMMLADYVKEYVSKQNFKMSEKWQKKTNGMPPYELMAFDDEYVNSVIKQNILSKIR
ncbi:hypothetical protein MHBO_000084 [Bonamia ostreae]|uniref:Uncharacterized protein n=1 Tax=Bonamia ostreae TaxID=126728 RepID=A0ABV2AEB9_9EUKA